MVIILYRSHSLKLWWKGCHDRDRVTIGYACAYAVIL